MDIDIDLFDEDNIRRDNVFYYKKIQLQKKIRLL